MKIEFINPKKFKEYSQFCINCHSEKVEKIDRNGLVLYACLDCGLKSERMIVLDPYISWWIDPVTKEYWHESVGVFVFNKSGQTLFFKRVIYPFVLTIPAGHLDCGEIPEQAAKREVFEETGINLENLKLVVEEKLYGDKCRRGSDDHMWHLFSAVLSETPDIILGDEGIQPVWLSLGQAKSENISFASRHFIEKHGDKLNAI